LAPPDGIVSVRGPIGASRAFEGDDAIEQRGGRDALPRVDLDRIGQGVPYPLRPIYVTAQWQEPAPLDGVPALPDPPATDDVNHLSYAFQWFAFALIPLVGWPIVLYRVARRGPSRSAGDRVRPSGAELAASTPSGDTRPTTKEG
jgi:hypothetical protein